MHLPGRSLPWRLAALLLTALHASLLAAPAEAGQDRWTPIGLGEGIVSALAVDPNVPGVVYAAVETAGIYRSTDGTRTWQWLGASTKDFDVWTDVVVAPNDPQRLYATSRPLDPISGAVFTSSDGGAHWRELDRRREGFASVAASPNGTLFVTTTRFGPPVSSEVRRSVDDGRTWSSVLITEHSSDPPLRVAVDPFAPDTVYAFGQAGLWRSTDNGLSFTRTGTWPNGELSDNVYGLAFPGNRPGFLYALMRSRLYRSEDGGLTWSGGVLLSGGFADLAVDPADPRTVYAVGFKIFVSHDGGDTAAELPQPPSSFAGIFPAIAISPAAPETLYVSSYGLGVVVSSDEGEHWTLQEQRGLTARQGTLAAAPSGRLYQTLPGRRTTFRSLDRGASWTPLASVENRIPTTLAEEAGAPDRLWAADGSLLHSTDGGASWSAVSLTNQPLYHVASPARHVVLAGGCGIWRTADSGRTWAPVLPCFVGQDGEERSYSVDRLGVPPGWPGAVWAEVEVRSTFGPQSWLVLFSQNAGRTWRTLARSETFSSFGTRTVAASRGVIYLNRGTALLRSRDAGKSWDPIAFPGRILSFAVDAADPDILYAATRYQGVLRSTDGGRTWSPVNAGLARLGRLWIEDIVADPKVPSVAYAFPAKGGIFQARFTD